MSECKALVEVSDAGAVSVCPHTQVLSYDEDVIEVLSPCFPYLPAIKFWKGGNFYQKTEETERIDFYDKFMELTPQGMSEEK